MTILIVDDNEQNLYQLQVLLQGNGYEVIAARNGVEALQQAHTHPPDLVVTDILMPQMDGFSLCRKWKQDEGLRPIPLFFYTATYTEERDREFALGLGAERFIVKPEEPDVFLRAIREAIEHVEVASAPARAAVTGTTSLPVTAPEEEETSFLRQHNDTLTRKLEAKLAQLEQSHRALEQDIAVRQQTEARLQAALAERTALLNEIHHRVKNNLQIVTSLLSLQCHRVRNPEALAILREAQNRVHSLALVHRALYRSESLARVHLPTYLESLCAHVFRSFGAEIGARIKLVTRFAPVELDLEQAVPAGLIVNDLLSNALKHAFPDGRSGQVTLELRAEGEQRIILSVADDGIGLPAAVDPDQPQTLGLQLVATLAKQLGATLAVERTVGSLFRLSFSAHPPPDY